MDSEMQFRLSKSIYKLEKDGACPNCFSALRSMKNFNGGNLYPIIDEFLDKHQMSVLAVPIDDENDERLGYKPKIKYYGKSGGERSIFDSTSYTKDLVEAYRYAIKEAFYEIEPKLIPSHPLKTN